MDNHLWRRIRTFRDIGEHSLIVDFLTIWLEHIVQYDCEHPTVHSLENLIGQKCPIDIFPVVDDVCRDYMMGAA